MKLDSFLLVKMFRNKYLSICLKIFTIRLLLDFSYNNIVSVVFGYQNFKNELTFFSYTVSWIFLITLCPLLVKNFQDKKLSSYVMSILVIT